MTLYNKKPFYPRDYHYSCFMDRFHPNKQDALQWIGENIVPGESLNQLVYDVPNAVSYTRIWFGFIHKEDYFKFCLLWL